VLTRSWSTNSAPTAASSRSTHSTSATIAVALSEDDVVAVFWITWSAPTALTTTAGASSHRVLGSTDTAASSPPPTNMAPGSALTSVDTPAVNPSR
jgi:hypothetical protein